MGRQASLSGPAPDARAGFAMAAAATAAAAGRGLLAVVEAFDGWWANRLAIDELRRLDDRLLADIGIGRGEVERAVRCGARGLDAGLGPRSRGEDGAIR